MKIQKPSISVQLDCRVPCIDFDTARLRLLTRKVCKRFDAVPARVSVSIVDDGQIQLLHKQFFNTTKTTDVISFDLTDELDSIYDFDIIINIEQARRQAQKRGHSTEAEIFLYLVHGLLHQLGFDDLRPDQARRMHREEDVILQDAGYGKVYDSTRKG
ncbi:MAG: rRNA maturation RNase YbeY [Sedimentisphaerales bacterium]|nr:rRNA maturation RNase YbeY [Sedimentisphaerales bacterium]